MTKVTKTASNKSRTLRSQHQIILSSTSCNTSTKETSELFKAVSQGDIKKVKDLIQHVGPSVRRLDSRMTLLHLAASENQRDIAVFLLDLISPNVVDSNNQTPAHLAAKEGHLETLEILLAVKETNPDIRDVWQQTYEDLLAVPLFEAILSSNEKQTRELLALGADPDSHLGNQVEGIVSRELNITTPRQLACAINHQAILNLLPKKKKNPINPLQSQQQNPPSTKGYRIGNRISELFKAVSQGDIQKVKDLIQHVGPSVRRLDSRMTLLHLAASENQKNIVVFLLDLISPNVVDSFNQTPAHLAAQAGHLEILKILLADKETNPDIKDVWQQTYEDLLIAPLLEAILSSNEKQTRELLALGADPDSHLGNQLEGIVSRELNITTPRQLACSLNHQPILKLLSKKKKNLLSPLQNQQQNPPFTKGCRIPNHILGPLRIKVKPGERFVNDNDTYAMKSNSKGYVCILSFGSFEGRPDLELQASEDDANNLANVFSQMGYSGEVHHSLTSCEARETLTRISNMKELNDTSCATFIISSHATSNNEAFLVSDMNQLSTEWLLGLFSEAECPQLKNKPKLFIFDFCRRYYTNGYTDFPTSFKTARVNEPQRDTVCIYSSNTGFTSYNFSKDGSAFPTALCRTLAKEAHNLELNDLFKELVIECRKSPDLTPLMKNIGFAKKFYFN